MDLNGEINIRDLSENDIELIANYWLKSDGDFMKSLGVDLEKLPQREELTVMLKEQIQLPDNKKSSLALIFEVNNIPVGHCNVNNITFNKEATMHLHIWDAQFRKKGFGAKMVLASLPIFFDRLQLETIWCEPYSKNTAPNKTLKKIGFEFTKNYVTVPGSLNFEQEVSQYKLTKEKFIYNSKH